MKKILICGLCFLLSGCTTVWDALTPYQEPQTRCKYDDATPIDQFGLNTDLSAALGDTIKTPKSNLSAELDSDIGTPVDIIWYGVQQAHNDYLKSDIGTPVVIELYAQPQPLTLRGRYEIAP